MVSLSAPIADFKTVCEKEYISILAEDLDCLVKFTLVHFTT